MIYKFSTNSFENLGEKMEIWKNVEIWGKIWKFGGNLEILRIFGNLEKIEIWKFRKFFGNLEKKLETSKKFGNL